LRQLVAIRGENRVVLNPSRKSQRGCNDHSLAADAHLIGAHFNARAILTNQSDRCRGQHFTLESLSLPERDFLGAADKSQCLRIHEPSAQPTGSCVEQEVKKREFRWLCSKYGINRKVH
jgi:hypothetical protein